MGKIGMWCGWMAAAAALAWGQQVAVGRPETAAVEAAVTPAPAAGPAAGDARQALREENLALKVRAAELEAAVYRLEKKVSTAAAETARYRDGLERAVAALNQRSSTASAPPPRSTRRSRSSRSSGTTTKRIGRIRGKTRLQVLGDEILVTATLKNSRAEAVSGPLTIELLRDGQVVDTADTLLTLPPRGQGHHQHRFVVSGFDAETYKARAYLEP